MLSEDWVSLSSSAVRFLYLPAPKRQTPITPEPHADGGTGLQKGLNLGPLYIDCIT